MTDLKAGKNDIKQKTLIPKYKQNTEFQPSRFQRNVNIKIKVPKYHQIVGKLSL